MNHIKTLPARLRQHLHNGTLLAALRRRLPLQGKVLNRFSAATPQEAVRVLTQLTAELCRPHNTGALLIGRAGALLDALAQQLAAAGIRYRIAAPESVPGLDRAAVENIGCITLAMLDSRTQLELAMQLVRNPATAAIALEYVAIPQLENAEILAWDRHRDGSFVSPLLGAFGNAPAEVYRESLSRFHQKTDVRDYLDLWQLLHSLNSRSVPGNIAEFGSFKGHSGYLISRVLEKLGSKKTLFMFDMFENFPAEDAGVDRFWSGTHLVNFEQVKKNFEDRTNVRLIKGDFTQTVLTTDTGPLALTYIDCDSYRATRFLLEYLWNHRVPAGGIVAMEDYGHAALLGNRVAVHEFFDGRQDAYTYFSQFSGFFIAVKMDAPGARAVPA